MRYPRLLAAFARAELQFSAEYRVDLALEVIQQVIVVVTSYVAVLVLYDHTGVINGWTFGQMIVLLGVYYLIQGANSVVFEVSFERFMEHVRLGTLDYILIKPVNSQFAISVRHIQLVHLGQALLGLVLVGTGAARLEHGLGALETAAFAVTLVCGLSLVYSLLLALCTLAFWFVRIDNLLAIFWSFIDAGRFPVDVYPGWLRVTLSTVVPIGIAVTVPAQAIAGRLDGLGLGAMLVGSVGVWLVASWFWRLGVRNYTGASA